MSAITAADVKKLRDATGAGMMDAKKALTEADGDFDAAIEILRVSGQAKMAKRSDREASNGLVASAGKSVIQLGAETDFVAKNAEFMTLADDIAKAVDAAGAHGVEAANAVVLPSGKTLVWMRNCFNWVPWIPEEQPQPRQPDPQPAGNRAIVGRAGTRHADRGHRRARIGHAP